MSNSSEEEIYRRPSSASAEPFLTQRVGSEQDPPLTACPSWCRYGGRNHGWVSETSDGRTARTHVVEFGNVEADPDERGRHPDAYVAISEEETLNADGSSERDRPRVALSTDFYPHYTAEQARTVAALLLAAADQLDEIVGA